MMKYLVAVVVFTGFLVGVCNAFCFHGEPKEVIMGEDPPEGCLYEGQLYELGSKFRTEDCMDCDCDSGGQYHCCSAYGIPVGYNPRNCKFVFNEETCTFDLKPNKDPKRKCEQYGMIG
ncbi:beta-microseminoprotein-like [Mixophyes fleayi]|uniref:beta-microseminoprotein-like n=1 Tax=Mixophyes fleayi TaxID=3061075 RepID=UPI003F4DC7D0